jgi:hypothetical protein
MNEIKKSEYNFELPKEINEPLENFINDILAYGLFIGNNQIWILKGSEKKKYFASVSNFEIEILQHIQDELKPLKLIRITNISGEERVFDVLSTQFNSISNFDNIVTSYGNFLFTGVKADFDLLRRYLFDRMGNGRKIDSLGYQKEGEIWVWNNRVNLFNGKKLEIDKNGMFIHNNISYYVPSANQVYKKNEAKFISQKKFKYIKTDISISEYLQLLFNVYEQNAIPATLFTIGSLFQDLIVDETKFFPILFLQGEMSSGKDNLALCCQSFLGVPQDKISLGAGLSTQKSQVRELAQFANGISHFSEYKTGDKTTDEILKGIWDRNGYKIATLDSKISTDMIPVLNSLILTSNYSPFDEALVTRLIWLTMNKNSNFTTEDHKNFDQLSTITKNGISKYSDDLLFFRDSFSQNFISLYRKRKMELMVLFDNPPVRIASNYAVLYAVYDFFSKEIKFPFSEEEMKMYFSNNCKDQMNKLRTGNIVSRWWDCFFSCMGGSYDNLLLLDKDYRVDGDNLSFNFSSVFSKIQRQWYIQYRENIPSKNTMYESIKRNRCFLELKSSFRIDGSITSALVFEISKIDIGNEILHKINCSKINKF